MKKGDKSLTPDIAYTDTKANILAYPNPIEGMHAVATDTNESGIYSSAAWHWGSGGGGTGGAFQRVLSSALTLANGESLVIADYIDLSSYSLALDGDATLEIL